MWTVIHSLLKDPVRGPETRRVLKSNGAQVWSYQCRRYMQRRDILEYFRFYPWECRLMGVVNGAFMDSVILDLPSVPSKAAAFVAAAITASGFHR